MKLITSSPKTELEHQELMWVKFYVPQMHAKVSIKLPAEVQITENTGKVLMYALLLRATSVHKLKAT